ncbi:MAG: cation:proton antiporter [bacterium]
MLILQELVTILVAAVAVVALLHRFKVPSIAGFIIAGAIIGPNAFGLISDVHQVEVLAEAGIVLLLFSIGMELSLDSMRRLWHPILIGGGLQVGVTIVAVMAIATLLGYRVGPSIFLGFVAAVSSTAIVLRGLRASGELDAPHGRLTLGILVFQDLCVVPMILAIPLLSGAFTSIWEPVAALLKATGVLVFVLVAARLAVPHLLRFIAQTGQRDLFVLTVALICLGIAWAVANVGISLALGAFLAGLVVAGSEFRHQALADIVPFREVLVSVFFVSVGMLIDPLDLVRYPGAIFGLLAAIILGKFAVVFLASLVMRLPMRVCVMAGAALAQIGEFSFVLTRAAQGSGLIEEPLAGNLTMAVILSMLITPVAIVFAPHLAAGVGRINPLTRRLGVRTPEDAGEVVHALRDHVVIAGYGVAGQELARSLKECGIAYLIVDLNAQNVQLANQRNEPALFGDVTSPEVLEHLAAGRARELVLVINDPGAAVRAIKAARRVAPSLTVMVRTRYLGDVETLLAAGADDVMAAEIEASVEVTSRVLSRHRVERSTIETQLSRIRGLRREVVLSDGP